jgi:hypothetical protein
MMTTCSVSADVLAASACTLWLMLTHRCLGLAGGRAKLRDQLAAACDAVVTRDARAAADMRATTHWLVVIGDDDDVLGRCRCALSLPLCVLLAPARWLMLTHRCLALPVSRATLARRLAAACDAVVTRDARAAAGPRATTHWHVVIGDDDDVLGRCRCACC